MDENEFFVRIKVPKIFEIENNITEIENSICGKKIILLGDSQIGTCRMEDTLSDMLKTKVFNCGFGGCRWTFLEDESNVWNAFSMVSIAQALTTNDFSKMDYALNNPISSNPFPDYFSETVQTLKALQPQLGNGSDFIVTISYGANDYSNNKLIGTENSENSKELYGAMNLALSSLQETFPCLTIILVSLTYRVYQHSDGVITQDSDDESREIGDTTYNRCTYGDKIIELGKQKYHLPTFDMYRSGGRNKYNIFTLCPDGVHPTSFEGIKITAEKYKRIILSF